MRASRFLLAVIGGLALAAPVGAESSIGVVGGVNLATFHETPAEEGVTFATRSLFEAGAVVDIGLGRRLSLRLEPMFLAKGSNINLDFFGKTDTASLRLSYVELPVLLSLSLGSGSVRPYVLAGPTVGYLTGAKATDQTENDKDVLSMFVRTDLGVSFGGGLRFPADKAQVFVEVRYSLGLKNVAKDSGDVIVKNRGVQVAAGVTFPFGRR